MTSLRFQWERVRKEEQLALVSGARLGIKEILDLHASGLWFFFCTNTKGQASLVFDLLEQALASNVNPPEGEQIVKTPLRFPSTLLCWTVLWMCLRDELAALTEPSCSLSLNSHQSIFEKPHLKRFQLINMDAWLHLREILLRHSSASHCVKTFGCFFTNWFLFFV